MLSQVARWRDWRLPVKLVAVILTPLVVLVVLGVLTVRGQVHRADAYARVNRVAAVSAQVTTLTRAVQRERAEAARLATVGSTTSTPQLRTREGRTNRDADALLGDPRPTGWPATARANLATARARLIWLPGLRRQALAGSAAGAAATLSGYTEVVTALIDLGRSVAAQVGQPTLTPTALALTDVQSMREEVSLQQSIGTAAIIGGATTLTQAIQLGASADRYAAYRADLRAVAAPEVWTSFQHTVSGSAVGDRNRYLAGFVARNGVPASPQQWDEASTATLSRTDRVATGLAQHLRTASARLQDRSSDAAGLLSVILFAAVVVAGLITITIARHLVRSLDGLRRSASTAAETLPAAVADIRAGHCTDSTPAPVPVRTTDEIGQVARAFEDLQGQALRLAVEQAELRRNYRDVFVNLSRRSESLVRRQLRMIERLEREEEDPDQLATLFALDHLATRMRRNNENLMVLSGTESGRRVATPLPLSDVLRAAVSEVEQYQRITVQPPTPVSIVGYAAGDLVRLLAELLENATSFSAPDTPVTIGSYPSRDHSVSIEVLDQGLGMTEDELATVNARLAAGQEVGVSTSRQMGLFVIGRLAERHDIVVRLGGGQGIRGLRVTVTVPEALIVDPGTLTGATTTAPVAVPVALPVAEPLAIVTPANGHGTGPAPEEPGEPLSALEAPLPPEPEGSDTGTPIFDAVLSAWFTSHDPATPITEWVSAGDAGWQRAASVHDAPPIATEVTTAGLPRRIPGARVVPGAVETDAAPEPEESAERGAERLRGRLGSFQRGLQQGRHVVARPPVPEQVVRTAEPVRSPSELAGVAAVTSAGLPRRTPGAQVLPGSLADPADPAEAGGPPDADEVRDRLADFQRGLRLGRDGETTAPVDAAELERG